MLVGLIRKKENNSCGGGQSAKRQEIKDTLANHLLQQIMADALMQLGRVGRAPSNHTGAPWVLRKSVVGHNANIHDAYIETGMEIVSEVRSVFPHQDLVLNLHCDDRTRDDRC